MIADAHRLERGHGRDPISRGTQGVLVVLERLRPAGVRGSGAFWACAAWTWARTAASRAAFSLIRRRQVETDTTRSPVASSTKISAPSRAVNAWMSAPISVATMMSGTVLRHMGVFLVVIVAAARFGLDVRRLAGPRWGLSGLPAGRAGGRTPVVWWLRATRAGFGRRLRATGFYGKSFRRSFLEGQCYLLLVIFCVCARNLSAVPVMCHRGSRNLRGCSR